MAAYVGYRDGGRTNEEGLMKQLSRTLSAGVPLLANATSLQVVQRAAGANMSVDVSIGDVHIYTISGLYSYWGWTDAATNVGISASNATNPRIDTIVAYIDLSVVMNVSNNNPNALKFMTVTGTAAASPVAPTNAAIQAAVGSLNPYQKLATVATAANVTSISNANISDIRTAITSTVAPAVNTVSNSALQSGIGADKLTNPYKFSAYLNANQSIPGAFAPTKVTLSTKIFDTSSNFDAVTNFRFIAPIAGFYYFSGQTSLFVVNAVVCQAFLYKNGSGVKNGSFLQNNSGGNNNVTPSVSGFLQLAANDYVELYVAQNNAGGQTLSSGNGVTWLDGFLVSTT